MVPYFAPKPLRGGASKGWKVKMCEGGPPSLSLGRLAELWRVIRMCEGSFERESTSAGVLGKTAPAVAGSRMRGRFLILDWEKQVGRG